METPIYIEDSLYRVMVQSLPIACADVIVKRGKHYLLVRRRDEPLRGSLWVPGGRILKNEPSKVAAERKVLEETGIKVKDLKFIGYYEDFYDRSAFGVGSHTISMVFEGEALPGNVTIDSHSYDYVWSDYVPAMLMEKLVRT